MVKNHRKSRRTILKLMAKMFLVQQKLQTISVIILQILVPISQTK